MSNIIGKDNFKRMRHSLHLVITALTMFYIGGTSFRKITTTLKILYNIKVSHVTVSDWRKKFAPIFLLQNAYPYAPAMNFVSDEWHADETVVKILGKNYYIWFIIDSETRFVLGFHLSPHRDSPQAFNLFDTFILRNTACYFTILREIHISYSRCMFSKIVNLLCQIIIFIICNPRA